MSNEADCCPGKKWSSKGECDSVFELIFVLEKNEAQEVNTDAASSFTSQ